MGWCVRRHETGERVWSQKAKTEPLGLGFSHVAIWGDREWLWVARMRRQWLWGGAFANARLFGGFEPKNQNQTTVPRFRAAFVQQQAEGGATRSPYTHPW
jgi:hypothetical protein